MSEIKNGRLGLYGAEHLKCNRMVTMGSKGLRLLCQGSANNRYTMSNMTTSWPPRCLSYWSTRLLCTSLNGTQSTIRSTANDGVWSRGVNNTRPSAVRAPDNVAPQTTSAKAPVVPPPGAAAKSRTNYKAMIGDRRGESGTNKRLWSGYKWFLSVWTHPTNHIGRARTTLNRWTNWQLAPGFEWEISVHKIMASNIFVASVHLDTRYYIHRVTAGQWRSQQLFGELQPRAAPRDGSPIAGSRGEVPPAAEGVCKHCRNDQNMKILHNSPMILDQSVSRWGLSDILRGLSQVSPKPMASAATAAGIHK